MKVSDETLMAYADGELDEASRVAFEAAMAADPALARRVAQQRALRERVRAAFDPLLAEPPPPRLLATLRESAPRSATLIPWPRRAALSWWPQAAALAASLVVGVLVGTTVPHGGARESVVERDGRLIAAGALAQALSSQLASNQPPQAPVQIGVSIRSRGGEYCRSFLVREPRALAGLACREPAAWRLEVLAQSAPPATAVYRPAGSALPPAVAQALDELRAGDALDAGAEAAARARGWSR